MLSEESTSTLPHVRFSMQVKNRQHWDGIYRFDEIHTIREVSEEGTADLAFHSRKLPRIGIDPLKQETEFVQESHTQAGSLVFVPYCRSLDVEVGLRLDDEPPCHPSDQRSRNLRSISDRASVQDRPAAGFSRYASRRS